jgi:hypothetical protein
MQAILIELIENFEFSPPPGNIEIIRRVAGGVLSPMLSQSSVDSIILVHPFVIQDQRLKLAQWGTSNNDYTNIKLISSYVATHRKDVHGLTCSQSLFVLIHKRGSAVLYLSASSCMGNVAMVLV